MEELIQGFIDEAIQLIEDLEKILLEVDETHITNNQVQEIFRVMHTIKGSSGMFQFKHVEDLTHCLEDVYDEIRNEKRKIDEETISLTLKTSDILKELLHNHDNLHGDMEQKYRVTLNQVANLISQKDNITQEDEGFGFFEDKLNEVIEKRQKDELYYICFKPDADVLKRGLIVPNLFEELEELGELKGIPYLDNVPDPVDFDPTSFYLSWDLFLKTQSSVEDIEDCFMFYLGHEFDLIKLIETDLSKNEVFAQTCIGINSGNLSLDHYQQLIEVFTSQDIEVAEKELIVEKQKPKTRKKNKEQAETIKVNATKLDELVNLVSELVTLNSRLELFSNAIDDDLFKKTVKSVSKLSKRFRDNALDLRLIPVKVLELKMQRLIRDLSKQLNKQVEFMVEGTKTELDKNIIARLEGPIMHILRNSLDHGLESTKERLDAGKPEKGVIRFIAFYSGSNVFIQIQDDGKGINPEKIKQKAIDKGLIQPDKELEKHEVFDLLFKPGFSTVNEISNVSGRGVGLDVVRSEIQNMRGEIDIESEIGLGTSFTLKLPLTLSIIDTLMTQVNKTKILIPRESIVQTNLLRSVNSNADAIEFEGELIPAISLKKEFGESELEATDRIIVINQNEKKYALLVDNIFGEHQAVVKPLGYYNTNHNYFSGASVMGDGSLALIIDLGKLINNKISKSSLGNYNLK